MNFLTKATLAATFTAACFALPLQAQESSPDASRIA